MTEPATSSMRRDVISAYLASAAKILSWVIVYGLVYRFMSVEVFSMFAMIRGTIGILNYTTLGLSPAMIRMLAEARQNAEPVADITGILNYETPRPGADVRTLYANGLLIALVTGTIGLIASVGYAAAFAHLYRTPPQLTGYPFFVPVALIGCGTVLRLMSDAGGSLIQASGQIARDNWRLVEAESVWVVLCLLCVMFSLHFDSDSVNFVAFFYALSGAILFYRRSSAAAKLSRISFPIWELIDGKTIRRLLTFGSLVLFAQLADYLYAPTDYILINRLLGWAQVAVYTPAMQIDAGLLLLVGGLSSVILPRTALAHTAGETDRIRRYYIYGTLGSALLLVFAGIVVFLASPLIFRLWLGDPMPATQAILPLVLVHTLVGGSSAVGRSILLGMGKVKPFTISVLIAGVSNVLLSYFFVRYCGLGLQGIVLGTIIAVIGRCAIWMPWYVLRSLRKGENGVSAQDFT